MKHHGSLNDDFSFNEEIAESHQVFTEKRRSSAFADGEHSSFTMRNGEFLGSSSSFREAPDTLDQAASALIDDFSLDSFSNFGSKLATTVVVQPVKITGSFLKTVRNKVLFLE